MSEDIRQDLRLVKSFKTLFNYPRPLNGKARSDLESEIKRLIHKAGKPFHGFIYEKETALSLIVPFATAADRDSFYKQFKTLSDYSLDYIFDYPSSEMVEIYNVKNISSNKTLPQNNPL